MEENCSNCKFKKVTSQELRCRRFPKNERKAKKDWCGEWRAEDTGDET